MRRPRRDKIEYFLYATVMTSVTVALGLGCIFATDEHGNRRKPVMDQPLDESLREAQMELRDYRLQKRLQVQHWCIDHGYEDFYRNYLASSTSTSSTSSSSKTSPTSQQQPPSYLQSETDAKKHWK